MQRPLGMGEGSVSVAGSLLSPSLVTLRPVLRESDSDQEGGSAADYNFLFFSRRTAVTFPDDRDH